MYSPVKVRSHPAAAGHAEGYKSVQPVFSEILWYGRVVFPVTHIKKQPFKSRIRSFGCISGMCMPGTSGWFTIHQSSGMLCDGKSENGRAE